MSIETKMDLGNKIYAICCTTFVGKEVCDVCNGEGTIEVKNWGSQGCPKCYGNRYIETYGEKEWRLDSTFDGRTIGKIEAEKSLKRKNSNQQKITAKYYPVGMGNYINEENIFKTEQEALDECVKRNAEFV